MLRVSASQFYRAFGSMSDKALARPVAITKKDVITWSSFPRRNTRVSGHEVVATAEHPHAPRRNRYDDHASDLRLGRRETVVGRFEAIRNAPPALTHHSRASSVKSRLTPRAHT